MSNEKMINVPLDEETKAALETSARENGRAVGREAAMLVKRGLASFRRGLKDSANCTSGRAGTSAPREGPATPTATSPRRSRRRLATSG